MKPNRADLRLKQATLDEYGLPDIGYPVPANALESILFDGEELPLALMLRGLQEYSGEEDAPWRSLEPALERLAELLAPEDGREVLSAASERWWLEVGPVDLNAKLVTIQRGDDLVAAVTPREDGRLRVATFRPLDGKSAEYLIGLGLVPQPDGRVCMRENNWEYALDCSAGMGNYYAADRGEAYLSYWEKGLGISSDGSEVPVWRKQVDLVARPAAPVIAELGVYSTVSLDAYVAPADETVPAVSAASCIAKYHRDAYMRQLARTYPEYGFDAHKGYGTKLHQEALARYGVSHQHRHSFAPIKALIEGGEKR